MTAYDANFEIDLPPDIGPYAESAAAIRAIAQVPIDLRAQGIRLVLFVGALLLTEDAKMREAAEQGFFRAMEGYVALQRVLSLRTAGTDLHPDAFAILQSGVEAAPAALPAIEKMARHAEGIWTTLHAGAIPTAGDFDAMMRVGYGDLHPTVLGLGAVMARTAATTRETLARSAEEARKRALAARGRIDTIARTVGMILLNARVEAARAGSAGRAFGVIAEEIRALSVQTETANREMAESLEEIMSSFRAL